MQTEVINDYAKPCMDAERALKDAHNAVLDNDLDLAITKAYDAIVHARLVLNALRLMKEKQCD
jgi:uncharacterized protein (UPF0332 family)